MHDVVEQTLLRIYLGENDRNDGKPLFEALVVRAREMGVAGATVLRGPLGYGRTSRLHTAKIVRLSEDLPVVVEIVDEDARIDAFLTAVASWLAGQLVTLERVRVVHL